MANIKDYEKLLEKTMTGILDDVNVFREFLESAAWNYKYSLSDKLLIYAQKPEAIACADFNVWKNKQIDRVVKRGTKGIGLIDKNHKISYVYDVGDTIAIDKSKVFSLWEMKEDLLDQVKVSLADVYLLPDNLSFVETIGRVIDQHVSDVCDDYYQMIFTEDNEVSVKDSAFYKTAVEAVTHMVYARMGLKEETAFAVGSDTVFSDVDLSLVLLSVISKSSESVLRELGSLVKTLDKEPPVVSKIERSAYYEGQNFIQAARGLFDSAVDLGGSSESREVWDDETFLSEGREGTSLFTADHEQTVSEPLVGNAGTGRIESEGSHGSPDDEPEVSGQEFSAGTVAELYEQSEAAGRGNDVSGSDLPLVPVLSAEKIEFLLCHDRFLYKTKEEILAVLSDNTASFDSKIEILNEAYDSTYCSPFYLDKKENGYVGFHKERGGLFLWEGNYLSRSAEIFLPFEEVITRILELNEKDVYLDKEYLQYEKRLSKEVIDYIIFYDEALNHSNDEISEVLLNDTLDDNAKKEYLMSAYSEAYTPLPYPQGEVIDRVGFCKFPSGLYMFEGTGEKMTGDSFLSWEEVISHRLNALEIEKEQVENPVSEREEEVLEESLDKVEDKAIDEIADNTVNHLADETIEKSEVKLSVDDGKTYKELSYPDLHMLISLEQFLLCSREELALTLLDKEMSAEEKVNYVSSMFKDGTDTYTYQERTLYGPNADSNKVKETEFLYEKTDTGLVLAKKNGDEIENRNILSFEELTDTIYRDIVSGRFDRSFALNPKFEHNYIINDKGQYEVTNDFFEKELRRGSMVSRGKFRIFEYFTEEHSQKELADFLKDEYGTGGHSLSYIDFSSEDHDTKGIRFHNFDHNEINVLIPWSKVASKIKEMISYDRYLNEKEVAYLPTYRNEQYLYRLDNELDKYFDTYYHDNWKETVDNLFNVFLFKDRLYGFTRDLRPMFLNNIAKSYMEYALTYHLNSLPEGEEKDMLDDILKRISETSSMQMASDPSWSSLDWELRRQAESNDFEVFAAMEGDIIRIQGVDYEVLEVNENEYICQNKAFPLFTEPFDADHLAELAKQSQENDHYFSTYAPGNLEVDCTLSGRNYRLLENMVPDLFRKKEGKVLLESEGANSYLIEKLNDNNIRIEEVKEDEEDYHLVTIYQFVLDPYDRTLTPVLFRSFDTGYHLNILDENFDDLARNHLERFVYEVFYNLNDYGYEIVKDKEIEFVTEENSLEKEAELLPEIEVEHKVEQEDKEAVLEDEIHEELEVVEEELEEEKSFAQSETELLEQEDQEEEIPVLSEEDVEIIEPEIPVVPLDPINYRIPNEEIDFGGPKARYQNNMEAIRLLKQLESEKRFANKKEQEILAKYVGWGGIASAFDDRDASWAKEYNELKELLNEEEYKAARESTLTSFYTPPAVISAMYEVLKKLGFENGNILEPSCGVGNFFGLLPEEMNDSRMYGVELDSISGRIAKQLYQNNTISVMGFEETNLPDSFFDVVIGNVPFGQFSVNDPAYKKEKFLIHDYFFAKALDKVRPGGIVAFITSKGTMDKNSIEVREYIAKRADLLGAVRLPNNTFTKNAGTKATSDIIFLQKRDRLRLDLPYWVYTDEREDGHFVNRYFTVHPDMVLGELKVEKGQYGREDLTCAPFENANLKEQLKEALLNIQGEYTSVSIDELLEEEEVDKSIPADISVQNFGYTLVDDVVYQRRDSRMYPVETNATALRRIRGLIELRDTTKELIHAQLEFASNAKIRSQQEKLNTQYDAFVEKYGYINSRGNSNAFSDDSSYFLLCSLERFDDEEHYLGKADIFTKQTIARHEPVTHADSAIDALAVSIQERACVDLDFMVSLLENGDKDTILEELSGIIFKDPSVGDVNDPYDGWLMSDEYLSGNVKEKLKVAKNFASMDPKYEVNVTALTQVQPKDLDATEISIRLGATWIPTDILNDFIYELFEVNENYRDIPENADRRYGVVKVVYNSLTDHWDIINKDWIKHGVLATSTYGSVRRDGVQLLEDTLNLKDTTIYDTYEEDGKQKRVVNKKETMIVQQKQSEIKMAFNDWIWNDQERRNRLVAIYNEKFNAFRPREYDGSHIVFHGMNPAISLREHQINAVARCLYGGNALLAHVVGAGKTFEMVAAAMEGKRLGLHKKPLFVVPNHLINQWASEFLQLYPAANILVATKKDFQTANRKKFCARIATGEWDAIIIGHSQFEKIPLSIERQKRDLYRQREEIITAINSMGESYENRLSVKQLERTRKSLDDKLAKLNNTERKDNVIEFEELGIDKLFIDEFHFYKNLWLYTKMTNIGGIAQTSAQKTTDLYMKCRYLDEITGGKGLVGATGTPVTNSMTELYSLQRYFAYHKLEELNLTAFDAWASTFGETVTAIELSPEGTNYRAKTRFSKFYNLPELMNLFKDFADVQTADMLNLPVPEATYETIAVEASPEQEEILRSLSERADAVRNGSVDRSEDNMLTITNDGRKLALDQRMIDPTLPDFEGSKVNACVDNVFTIYKDTTKNRSTQLIFCDLSTPHGDGAFNVYDDIKNKLIQKGIKESEIAFIHDANTEKRKETLFGNVRSGKVRILIGSTFKMGAGTNVQDLLIASHDLDCPWRPADLEQRGGRIIRQGNTNDEVTIFRYVTKNTFDAYLYQLVENKQRFISQIMTSKSPVRVAEDIDEASLNYAEIKALAAGNPMIKEKMDLDIEVSKLNTLKANFLRDRYRLEDDVTRRFPLRIEHLERDLKNISLDAEYLKTVDKDSFLMTIDGVTYSDTREAGKAFAEAMKDVKLYEQKTIGDLFGFKISYNKIYDKIRMERESSFDFPAYQQGHNNIKKLLERLSIFDSLIEETKIELDKVKEELVRSKKALTKDFPQEELLKEKNARLQELNILLNVDSGAGAEELLSDAKNVQTSPELLHKLAGNDDVKLRVAVAGNPMISNETMALLSKDLDESVLIKLISNESITDELIREMAIAGTPNVQMEILKVKEVDETLLEMIFETTVDKKEDYAVSLLRKELAAHPLASENLLIDLSVNGGYSVTSVLLDRENLPDEVFNNLSDGKEWYTKQKIAAHPKCPLAVLEKLSRDEEKWVVDKVALNPNVTKDILNIILDDNPDNYWAKKKMEELRAKELEEMKKPSLDALIKDTYLEKQKGHSEHINKNSIDRDSNHII